MQDLQTGLKCTGIYYGELNRKHTEGVDDETRNWGKKKKKNQPSAVSRAMFN